MNICRLRKENRFDFWDQDLRYIEQEKYGTNVLQYIVEVTSSPFRPPKRGLSTLIFLVIFIYSTIGITAASQITFKVLTSPIRFGEDVLISCFRPVLNESYIAWVNGVSKDYLSRGEFSKNISKYESRVMYTGRGTNTTLKIKHFVEADLYIKYECDIGFMNYVFHPFDINGSYLYISTDKDITVRAAEDKQNVAVIIDKLCPKPTCSIVSMDGSVIENHIVLTPALIVGCYKVIVTFSRTYICNQITLDCSFKGENNFSYPLMYRLGEFCPDDPNRGSSSEISLVDVLVISCSTVIMMLVVIIIVLYWKYKRQSVLCSQTSGRGTDDKMKEVVFKPLCQ